MIIKELHVPQYLLAKIGKVLISYLGGDAVRSIGITFRNYFNWPHALRYAFLYTYYGKENRIAPVNFVRDVFQKEKARSIIRLLFYVMAMGPWSDCSEESRANVIKTRSDHLRKALAELSTKDLTRVWKTMESYDLEKMILHCPKEFLLLKLGSLHSPQEKLLVEKRLKGD